MLHDCLTCNKYTVNIDIVTCSLVVYVSRTWHGRRCL